MDGLKEKLRGTASVMRLNLSEEVGSQMARRLNVHSVPTFIVFNGSGQEVWRKGGFPDQTAILRVIEPIE